MRVTIKDVAREAQVSISTVSRVMSGSEKISRETKKKVQLAVEKLNYYPNILARSLAGNASKVIGIILISEVEVLLRNSFYIDIMIGISTFAKKADYFVIYTFCCTQEEKLKYTKDYANGNLIDGIILISIGSQDESLDYLKQINFPFIIIRRPEKSKVNVKKVGYFAAKLLVYRLEKV